MIVVSNSSPLIVFGRLNHFDILRILFGEIIVPEEVYREVTIEGKGRPGAIRTQEAKWIRVKPILDRSLHTQMSKSYNLGSGEVATVILAKELSANVALIDERKARLLAKAQGISVLGSVGIFEISYRKGLVHDLRTIYQQMEQVGIRVDRRILNDSLAKHRLRIL
ncbi:hypothetical protein L0244_37580 [bacterium]|nr:hypothetical protein [bacterium]MCI0618724.1 hypothetical protein [bacterium]